MKTKQKSFQVMYAFNKVDGTMPSTFNELAIIIKKIDRKEKINKLNGTNN